MAFCSICRNALTSGLLHGYYSRRLSSAFAENGFNKWKKALEKFRDHETSGLHAESMRASAAASGAPVSSMLSESAAREKNVAKSVLEHLFRSLKYLGRQGIPVRGKCHRDGNLWQLMLERTFSSPASPEQRQWQMRRDNWMSDTIQNEILQTFAHAVQRQIVSYAQRSSFYGLTADGTTDVSGTEQFSCCLQYVDSEFVLQNVFLGFYNAPDSKSETLFTCITDLFSRLNLPIERLQGYCFDGAANMSITECGPNLKHYALDRYTFIAVIMLSIWFCKTL